jgi:uncharacterized protein (TIGR02246 family)
VGRTGLKNVADALRRFLTMTTNKILAGGVIAALAGALLMPSVMDRGFSAQPAEAGREADAAAIQSAAHEFAVAFNKGDARTIAAQWTDQGECVDADGETVRGRAEIEKSFAEFFKANPQAKIEVLVKSVRFPAPDLAVEEGVLRQINSTKDLPSSTLYSAVDVRSGGKWQTAVSREWGAGEDRLEDLEWLLGQWNSSGKDHDISLTFSRDEDKPFILGRFSRKDGNKMVSTGTFRIGVDPQTGQLRSWHFDEDGGHGQSLWVRDGNRWVLDATGVMGNGIETASVNIFARLNNDEITWQSIDRALGDQELPDTTPIKLTRVSAK